MTTAAMATIATVDAARITSLFFSCRLLGKPEPRAAGPARPDATLVGCPFVRTSVT
jgi:hypothetical protein